MSESKVNSDSDYDVMYKIYNHVKQHATKGHVDSVIETVDALCEESIRAMHIGKQKGDILDSLIREYQPNTVLELGAFFGYTALRIARQLKPGAMLHSVELDPEMFKVTTDMIRFAAMEDRIKVINGKSSDVLVRFHNNEFPVSSFDFVLLDHHKPLYKSDVILLEKLKLIKKGSVILADNIVRPGVPDYAEYVRNNPNYESTTFPIKRKNYDEMEKSVYICDD